MSEAMYRQTEMKLLTVSFA